MNTLTSRTWAEISLPVLRHNAAELRRSMHGSSELLGVVKANAYGHGAVPCARALREAGAAYLAVACPEEALELRRAGETLPILILGACDASWVPQLAENEITVAVESAEKGAAVSAAVPAGQQLKIHIKLDTGMGRLGFRAADEKSLSAAAEILQLPGLEPEGAFTHFAVSDEAGGESYTAAQYALFSSAVEYIEKHSGRTLRLHHCMNSGAVAYHRGDGFRSDLIRPGIMTYGYFPGQPEPGLDLQPVMELKSRVAAITHHKKGDCISYGGTWQAERDCTLAVLPIGYADGLQRCLSGRLEVFLHGCRIKQVGRICMDMCMLDITDHPEIQPGDVAVIFGRGDGVPTADELAQKAGTISYEILCGVSPRVPRLYTE